MTLAPFDWTTTDDFVQRALSSNATEEDAWTLYSTKRFGCDRQEFAATWAFWTAERERAA